MVTSIVLTGTHTIGTDTYGKFMVQDTKVSIKEVPFVRYRFTEYNDKELEYIKSMKNKFKYSSHMVEITLGEDTRDIIERLEQISNLIKFVYIPVDDTDVLEGLREEKFDLLANISDKSFDRLMLKDKSSTLDVVAATRIKKELLSVIKLGNIDDIGVCSSPLSFDGKNACLTALKARELSAEYAETDEVALPSANHECMNCCGCIRYYVFNGDVEAPVGKNSKASNKETTVVKEKKAKSKGAKPKAIIKWI